MQFDALTMTAVRDELRATLAGGHVQKLVLPGQLAIGLGIYANRRSHWLMLSAHPEHARIQLAGERLARASDTVTPMLLLLRKYVRNGRLIEIEQPPFERILRLTFSKILAGDDELDNDEDDTDQDRATLHGELTVVHLIIEVMGRYSNIILLNDQGMVLDAVKRVPATINRFRTVLPHQQYLPPPALTKQNPTALSTLSLATILAAAQPDAPLWRVLVDNLRGISPIIGREVTYRASGDTKTPATAILQDMQQQQAVLAALAEVLAGWETPSRWDPSVARDQSGDRVIAYAAYRLTQYSAVQPEPSISAAIDLFYSTSEIAVAYEGARKEVASLISGYRKRVELKHDALLRALAEGNAAERYRRAGELLLSYGYNLESGASFLEAEGEQIAVDPALSFSENAQHYFRQYTKAKNAVREVPELLEATVAQLAYLDQQAALLDVARNRPEIDAIRAELHEAGFGEQTRPEKPKKSGAKQKQKQRAQQPKRPPLPSPSFISADGLPVYIGHTARQNDLLTFELAGPNDIWFHARNIPGAHVIVKTQGELLPRRTLEQAAAAAAYYSQARQAAGVDVDYTEQRRVRRQKGAPPGLVYYTNERTLHVRPQPAPSDESRSRPPQARHNT